MREDGRFGSKARALIRQQIRLRFHTQERFAAEMSVHPDTISHWVNGSGGGPPSLMQLQKMCRLLGFTPNDLLLEPEELEVSRQREALTVAREWLDRLYDEQLGRLGPDASPSSGGASA